MTFSIAARCQETGQLGIALSSSSIAVGARCPWLLAGVGAVSSQNITLPSLGPLILAQMAQGLSPPEALHSVLAESPFSEYRQVTVINVQGDSAAFSGTHTLGIHYAQQGENCVAAGNMLAHQGVISAMVQSFENQRGSLTHRLLHALEVAAAQGGEAGPVHSAAVKVVADVMWPVVDLRVDWAETDPIARLQELWRDYQPQMEAYQIRALDPRAAPSYGVPGDE